MSVGRWARAMAPAIVNDFPDPVMPSSVWYRSPRSTPVASASIASGWSPAAVKGETSSRSGICPMVPAACDGLADGGDSVRHILGVEKGGAA